MDATARNAQRGTGRLGATAGTFSHDGTHGRDGDTRSDVPDDEHPRGAHGPILTADDLAVLEAELARQRAADTIAVDRDRASMPSIKPDRIRSNFTKSPKTGDIGFTMTVVARKSGIEVNGDLIGPREQGWASAAERFGRSLAVLCKDDEHKRQQQARAGASSPAPSAAWASSDCARPGQRRHDRVARGPHLADEPVMSTRHPDAGHRGR